MHQVITMQNSIDQKFTQDRNRDFVHILPPEAIDTSSFVQMLQEKSLSVFKQFVRWSFKFFPIEEINPIITTKYSTLNA